MDRLNGAVAIVGNIIKRRRIDPWEPLGHEADHVPTANAVGLEFAVRREDRRDGRFARSRTCKTDVNAISYCNETARMSADATGCLVSHVNNSIPFWRITP